MQQYGAKQPPPAVMLVSRVLASLLLLACACPRPVMAETADDDPRLDVTEAGDFWSFQPIRQPELPAVRNAGWPYNSVDRFVLARLEADGLIPVADADRRTLIRRATFDLIGLPPTPEEVRSFLDDAAPDAFERLVERLLNSPQYGERWGRHWLDVARYADTAGDDNQDFPVPQAYRYRNYVIDAFNQDKPFDLFLQEQIAGDLMPSESDEQKYERIIATGYLALSRRLIGGQHLVIEDTLDTLGRSVLGITLGCARCHDHKFDPISEEDYYALYGFLQSTTYASTTEGGGLFQRDFVPLMPPAKVEEILGPYKKELVQLDQQISGLADELKQAQQQELESPSDGEARDAQLEAANVRERGLEARMEETKRERNELFQRWPEIDDAYAVQDAKGENARVQQGGDPQQLGDEVPRRFLEVFGSQPLPPETTGSGRLQLAQWLTDAARPLTARVIVNRIWQHHFGRGIAQSSSDFGSRGIPPTHPELLNYLTHYFLENGWSIKSLHRQIMLSHTYQLASRGGEENYERDPNNDLLWKFHRLPLEAEAIRDAMLLVSGELDSSRGGRHPFPTTQREWAGDPFRAVYDTNRRSVYVMQQKRAQRHPFFCTFDGADPNVSTEMRSASTTPVQALYLMNNPFVHERATALAARLMRDDPQESSRIDRAFELTLARPPTDEERTSAISFLENFESRIADQDERERASLAGLAQVLLSSSEFFYID